MDLLLEFLPLLSIMTMGAGSWKLLTYFHPVSLRKTEYFNIFLLLGSFLLIFPLTLIGIQPDGLLQLKVGKAILRLISFKGFSFLYFLISLVISIIICYYSIKWLIAHLENFNFKIETLKDYRIILIILLLLDYLFLELIQPLRGFDALYYYLPEADIFSQAGRITEINYFSFLPVIKSPLNVLLFVYTNYITGEYAIHLIPFLFLIGIVLLAYDFSMELFDNQSIALMACIFTLTLPFTFWLMNWWAFYQDLYLCYFFSIACYFCLKWNKNSKTYFFGVILATAIILAILTKITAWVLPLILLIWIPTHRQGKKLKILIITLFGFFLCIQTSTRIYIGNILPIVIVLSISIFLIMKEKSEYESKKINFLPIGIGVFLGSCWLINRISISVSVWQELLDLYFNVSNSIQWIYPIQDNNPLLHSLETMHRINFFSAAGILLLGTVFVLPWGLLKIYALKNYQPIIAPLCWIFLFFAIWLTYYSTVSIRYLTPILIPVVLCLSWGCFNIITKIEDVKIQKVLEILFFFTGTAFFYYIISLDSLTISDQSQEIIGAAYNKAAFDYYANPIILVLLGSFFGLVFYYGTKIELNERLKSLMKTKNLIIARTILFSCIIIIPIAVQSYLLILSDGDVNEFHAISEYEYRPEYKELIDVIVQQNQPFAGILTARTPGLPFFTKQPVIDLYYQQILFPGNPFFSSSNLTYLLEILHYPLRYTLGINNLTISFVLSIHYIVVPSISNLYYETYLTQIKSESLLFQSLENTTHFTLLFSNSDFLLYEVSY